jgi:hypothetical protein
MAVRTMRWMRLELGHPLTKSWFSHRRSQFLMRPIKANTSSLSLVPRALKGSEFNIERPEIYSTSSETRSGHLSTVLANSFSNVRSN